MESQDPRMHQGGVKTAHRLSKPQDSSAPSFDCLEPPARGNNHHLLAQEGETQTPGKGNRQAAEVRMRRGAWPQASPARPGPPSSKFRKLLYLAGERQGLRNPTSAARALEERGDWADGVPSGYRHPGPGLGSPLRGWEEPRDPA